ncbi:isopeptide-forming domain-containing fimbrial protein [Agathobaculum butyriciproducens]|uniref:isopeptide-forming domain-containing fimbrial protein n=1 Tax=Agathobaculum butyriciproducens TaxID=1628085 RepID=UPI002097965B|nr:isopeptide-forming domain-containing fimbrial protein [Agathobaculum butyriciproducens]
MSIIKRITSAGLSLAMVATIIPSSFAASTLSSVTAKYLDAENGKEIAKKQTYSVTHEEKSPQTITNYTYADYTESVEYVYSHKDLTYIIGYPDKGVHPNGDLTRAEAAMIFYRLYDGDYPSFTRRMSNGTFKDVNAKNWFYEPVETLYNIGLLEGKSKDTFAPNAPISRAEFAALAARFQNLKYTSGKVFSDVEKGHWAYSYINAASEAGWIQGYPDGTFRPNKEITRTETVTLVNNMINRAVTREKLKELNVKNPYNDLAESFWGYTDLMEATVSHTAEEWHDAKYNDGKYNIIVEKFVDMSGKEIAKSVTTAGKAESAPKSIPAYEYRGYIRTITYRYSTGDALPSIEKTASVKDAKVGDEITYTIKLSNDKKASSAWKSVVLTDKIPSGMTFIEGSVYVNNVAATHTVKNGTLTVNLGDIAAGKTVTVTFKAKINGDMYNQTIYNTAVAKGTNGYVTAADGKKTNIYEDKDDGVYVKKGDTAPYVTKTADKDNANVGDKITYTVKVGNSVGAVYEIENAEMADTIPTEFDFVDGSVQVDGKSYPYSYDNASRKLSVFIGNLKPNAARTVTFAVTVNKSAYGKTVHNTAVLSGDNIKDTEGKDKGVEIGDGKAKPQIDKTANKSSARVGDKIAYTLTVKNDDTATVPVENGVITDVLPAGLTFEYGSVTLNGKNTNDYTYDENTRLLTVNVGTIEPDAKQIIGFAATVNESAYNTTIQNLATLTSDNADPVQDKDDGVAIADGDALLTVSKSADKTTAKVGDTITYTVNAANATGADVNIRDAVMTDTIPAGLTFRGNVTVDGYSAEYQYDNTGKTLTVSLDEIAPNQTKAICFDVTVNSDAYGMHIENTALVSGNNTPDKSGTDNGVDIEDGMADGHAGNKTASKTTAVVGDTITYSIRLSNGAAATADWENMKVIDVLPDGVSFAGNVQENGSATVNYSYNATMKTITFTPDAIAAGAQTVLSFDVTVDDGSQGKFIVNTAILDDNGKETPMPDGGVQIDQGEAAPIVNKTASVTTANVGDTFTYTITAKNGNKATAAWKNVVMTDTLPTGVKLVGGVYINNEFALYHLSGNALSVLVGDLEPGESAEITFDVQVLESAAGTTITNTASLDGDNGHGTATDKGVTIPDTAEQPDVNTNFYVAKEVDKTVVNVGSGVSADRKRATFTITVGNDSNQTWKRVILKDTLDTTLVTPVLKNNVYVDGVLNSKWSFRNKVFTLELGDIAPNEKRVVKITVEFKTDAGGKTYTNLAAATGDNGSASGRSPEIEVVSSGSSGKTVLTDIHYQLFGGYADGLWRPNDRVSLQEACTVVYRLIANGGNTWLPRGTTTVPKYQYDIPEEAKYFVSIGVLPASAFDTTRMDEGDDYEINYTISKNGYLRIWAASGQLNSLVAYATKTNIGLSGDVSRLTFAKAICQITGRDTSPAVSGYSGNLRTWADAPSSVVTEVSHEHDFIMDSDRNEYWI